MRKLIVSVVALVFAGCAAQSAAPTNLTQPSASNAALSWRFVGLDALKAKTNLVIFREAAGLPEYEGFKSNLTARLSERLARKAIPQDGNPGELQKLLTPIAADLVQYPSLFEKESGPSNICSLAVKLPNDRHEMWKKNWDGILKAAKISNAKLTREGEWTLVSNGSSKAILDRARDPFADVLRFNGDASVLNSLLPALSPKKATLRVTAQGNGLRSEGKLHLDKELPFALEPWRVPAKTIRDPLIGFTAAQGVAGPLGQLEIFQNFKSPNQLFIWSVDETPFSTYAAAPIENPTNFVRAVADKLSKDKKIIGNLEMNTNTHRLSIFGLPVAVPYIAVSKDDPGFIEAGAIAVDKTGSKPMPQELQQQVTSRTNLVYYDWEITSQRLRQARPLKQLFAIATRKDLPVFDSPAHKWLLAFENKIGNTITELSLTNPRELSLIRRSDVGLSSLELIMLMDWIAGPNPAALALPVPTSK